MLVLCRNKDEIIRINNDIILLVKGFFKDSVVLSIKADESIPIHRLEIYEKINAENNSFKYLHSIDQSQNHPTTKSPKITIKKRKEFTLEQV